MTVKVGMKVSCAFHDLGTNEKDVRDALADIANEVGQILEVFCAAMLKIMPQPIS